MASSRVPIDNKEKPIKISVLQVEEITNWKTPPYDLLKCDIEGAEYTLINEYSYILQNTRYLIIEWHKESGDYDDLQVKICKLDLSFKNLHLTNFLTLQQQFYCLRTICR